jgi:tRNA nucleotidyltransferase/poly(A) polymerase
MLDLRTGDRLGGGARETSWRLEDFKKRLVEVQKQPFAIRDLKISGVEVMKELNLKPGPEVGKILQNLYDEVVEKKLENTKKILLEQLKTLK